MIKGEPPFLTIPLFAVSSISHQSQRGRCELQNWFSPQNGNSFFCTADFSHIRQWFASLLIRPCARMNPCTLQELAADFQTNLKFKESPTKHHFHLYHPLPVLTHQCLNVLWRCPVSTGLHIYPTSTHATASQLPLTCTRENRSAILTVTVLTRAVSVYQYRRTWVHVRFDYQESGNMSIHPSPSIRIPWQVIRNKLPMDLWKRQSIHWPVWMILTYCEVSSMQFIEGHEKVWYVLGQNEQPEACSSCALHTKL